MDKEYLKNGQFKFQNWTVFFRGGKGVGLNGASYDLLQNINCVDVHFLKLNNDTVYLFSTVYNGRNIRYLSCYDFFHQAINQAAGSDSE